MNNFDLIILGGGLAGGVLARGAGLMGLTVCVVDLGPPPEATSLDKRTTALSAACRDFFERLGIWPSLEARATPMDRIVVSEATHRQTMVYASRELKVPEPMGYMLHNGVLRHAIYQSAVATPGVTWVGATSPIALDIGAHRASVILPQGEITSALVVGADGKNSWTRAQLKIPVTRWKYDQTAIISVVSHPNSHMNVALEHFTPEGPLALLPMEGNTSGMVWSATPSLAERLRNADDEEAASLLNGCITDHRGPVSFITPRMAYPLELILPHRSIAPRACLIGDAAHCIHPVAGQGINVGFKDVEVLLGVLENVRRFGGDMGSITALEAYGKARRADHVSMALVTDGVVRLFSNHSRILSGVRKAGLRAINAFPAVKNGMMRRAMGYGKER